MRQSITQEFDYGCGIACFAFATERTYKEAVEFLGDKQATSTRFWIKDLAFALNKSGKRYIYKYVKPHLRNSIYEDGVIVLISRSNNYPAGHYVIRHKGYWMDPWINLSFNKDIKNAKSGYRKRLPGKPMYILLPSEF